MSYFIFSLIVSINIFLLNSNSYSYNINDITIYTEEDIPYVTVNEAKLIEGGLATEKVFKLLEKLHLPKDKIEIVPWARAYSEAINKENILVFPIVKTEERLKKLNFIIRLVDSYTYLYKLKARKNITIKKMNEAKKHSICVVRDDFRHEYLKKEGFNNLEVSSDSLRNVKKFMEERCDLIISSEIGIKNKLKSLKYNFELLEEIFQLKNLDSSLYLAINKSTNHKIIDRIKNAAKQIK
ncbi:substrate-binding periplasmic protein [Fluviispira multicolorata]|uniref:Transporter substrate-binding domain-containing protein n=1 Tax=Fluviispira multicolorata TaxID=2654512 RepID=A0A833JGD5_9BACT|nr:transporter substrate-binding domain-containing protein [Fluviispira multicolorata]KAB8032081.1 transporter substrate-binding domain-containing protein [Fluviispira multicolorata]